MGTSRRGFLIGAAFAPAGLILPTSITEQLALPVDTPKTGDKLKIITESRRGAVMYLSDIRNCDGELTIIEDDGRVLGTFRMSRLSVSYHRNTVDTTSWSDANRLYVAGMLEGMELDMTMRQIM